MANNQAIANTGSTNWYFTKYTQRAANVGGGKKRGGGKEETRPSRSQAETSCSCSMKEEKVVLTSEPPTFLKMGWRDIFPRESCRPVANYKNINKTLCTLDFFSSISLNLFRLVSKNISREIASLIFFPPSSAPQCGQQKKLPHICI